MKRLGKEAPQRAGAKSLILIIRTEGRALLPMKGDQESRQQSPFFDTHPTKQLPPRTFIRSGLGRRRSIWCVEQDPLNPQLYYHTVQIPVN